MSYLHCPACSRAYNLATQPSCRYCRAIAAAGEPVAPVSPTSTASTASLAPAVLAPAMAPAPAPATMTAMALTTSPHLDDFTTAVDALARLKLKPLLTAVAAAMIDRLAARVPKRLFRAAARLRAFAA
jgi:hypothetical protein